jgi:uncharacterized protein
VKVEDGFIVDAPIERVRSAIRDPDIVAPCVPGCQAVEIIGAKSYKSAFGSRSARSRPVLTTTVEITAEDPPRRLLSVISGGEVARRAADRA